MFCPSCGAEYAIELKYCKRCGANLNSALPPPPEMVLVNLTKPILIISATVLLLTLGGFVGLISGAMGMASKFQAADPLLAILVPGMFTILTVDIFLVRQLSRLISAAVKPDSSKRIRKQAAPSTGVPQFPRPSTTQLPEAPSVTESTTRFFEPVRRAPAETENCPPARNIEN
jgi:hypothetical protein